jgi:flagellar hook-associated protein 2
MAITPSITSLGIGSGLDANSIVSKLMALERAPLDALNLRESSYKARISAFGTIKTKFDALETAAGNLADPAKLAAFTATIGDKDILSASTGTLAGAGSYSINVVALAQAQKSFSSLYAGTDTFGAGTLTFNIGGNNVDIAFAGGSLSDVRGAINAANIGVTATTVTGDTGTRLVLTAKNTGTDNAFSLSVSGGDANLASLATFDAANPNARAALNATVQIEGETITSQSNEIKGAIPDVIVTAKKTGATTLDIARSSASALETVKAFVTAFNDAAKEMRTLSAYDPGTKKGGPLNGDSTVRTLQGLMRDNIAHAPTELAGTAYETLSALGISFQRDGTLLLDETKFNKAVDTDFSAVTQTLNAYGTKLSTLGEQVTRFDGLLSNRTDGLNATVGQLSAQRTRMEYQLSLTEKRMRAQYTALDSLMGQLSTTSAYLTQQLSTLNAG